jgi:hypothetical protein
MRRQRPRPPPQASVRTTIRWSARIALLTQYALAPHSPLYAEGLPARRPRARSGHDSASGFRTFSRGPTPEWNVWRR